MDNKSILITGAGGFIGKNLYKMLKNEQFNVFGVDIKRNETVEYECDVSDKKIRDYLKSVKPRVIVHLSALSNVEKCEVDKDLAYKSNVISTRNLCDYCIENDCLMIYMSSDYVFDGVGENFNENSPVRPVQYYGQTKLEAEGLVVKLKKYFILRPTVVFGWDPEGMNFFMQLLRKLKAGEVMNVPDDQISNPTYVLDLCQAIKKLIINPPQSGIYMSTGPESCSRLDFARMIAMEFSLKQELIVPKKTVELHQLARRPLNNSTNSSLLYREIGYKFHNLRESFSAIKELI